MATPLTDADIDRLSPPPALSDADMSAHEGSVVGDFAKGAWSKLSPVQMLRGMADTLEAAYNDPKGTAKNFATEVLGHPYSAFSRGVEAAKAGKTEEAMAHFASVLDPAGFQTEASQVKAATPGKRAEGFGELAGTGAAAYLGGKAPELAAKVPAVTQKAGSLVVPMGKAVVAAVPETPVFPKTVGDFARPFKAAGKAFVAARDAQAAQDVAALPTAPPPLPAQAATPPPVPQDQGLFPWKPAPPSPEELGIHGGVEGTMTPEGSQALTNKLNNLLRQGRIDAGADPDVPLGEVKGAHYPNRFGSDGPVIDSSKRRVSSTAPIANPEKIMTKKAFRDSLPADSPLLRGDAFDKAYKLAVELKAAGVDFGGNLIQMKGRP